MCCNSASGNSSIAYWNRFAIRLIHVCFYCFLIPFTLCESGIQNGDCFSCDQDSYFPWVTVLHTQEKKPLAILTNFLGKIVFISFPYHTLHAFSFFSLSIYINIWIVSQKYIEFHIVYAYKFPPSVCLCMCVLSNVIIITELTRVCYVSVLNFCMHLVKIFYFFIHCVCAILRKICP